MNQGYALGYRPPTGLWSPEGGCGSPAGVNHPAFRGRLSDHSGNPGLYPVVLRGRFYTGPSPWLYSLH